jgi:hypothetical protein
MRPSVMDQRWPQEAEAILTGFKEWRLQHPRATLSEIEAALDERLDLARARMLEEAALASPVADLAAVPEAERPRCGECGGAPEARGRRARELTVRGARTVRLRRSYGVCSACGAGVFPPG